MTRAYTPLLDKFQLTYPQYLVMLVLWEEDKQTVNQIGDRLYLDSGTLTPLLKRMQASGLIVRERSPEDERKVVITLTEQGHKMKVDALEVPKAMLKKSKMTLQNLIDLKEQLEKLIEAYRD